MTSNLLNNYIANTKQPIIPAVKQQVPEKKLTVQSPALSNRAYVTPLQARGKLVKGNIFDAPATMVKSLAYDMKALKNGLQGKANDHQLGKLNDLGMKLGGIAVAAFLLTKRQTPLTKSMEIVGPAAFFATMALWPKVALQWPARLIHGFNIQQKYEDAQGRKKPVFQDNQFVPFDLYSDKEINKIGDRMGIDKDIPNRRALIEEKMKKVAVQNNTLWMLTAGIATPVLSALACNRAEKLILSQQDKINNRKLDAMLPNLDSIAANKESKTMMGTLENLFELNRNKPVTEELLKGLTDVLGEGLDIETKKGIHADLSNMLVNGKSSLSESTAGNVLDNVRGALEKQFSKAEVGKFIPKHDEFVDFLKNKNVLGIDLDEKQLEALNADIKKFIVQKAKAAKFDADDIDLIASKTLKAAKETLSGSTSSTLSEGSMNTIRKAAELFKKHTSKFNVLDAYSHGKAADAPETTIANFWNHVTDKSFKSLKFTPQEIEAGRLDPKVANKILRGKMEALASNDTEYKAVIKEIAQHVAQLDQKIKPSDIADYEKAVVRVFDEAATNLSGAGFKQTAQQLTALNVNGKGSLKRATQTFITDRITSVKSSFYRFINTLDMYRRVSQLELGDELKDAPREVKEEIIELCKRITIGGHPADHSVKLPFNVNPTPNGDMSDIEVQAGKVINKYFGKTKGVSVPGDDNFYRKAMNFMFNRNHDKLTQDALQEAGLLDKVKDYTKKFWKEVGGADYFIKVWHKVCDNPMATEEQKFIKTGIAGDELFHKLFNKSFNTNKWLKIFGGVAAGLSAVTVASQFFFGKLKNVPKPDTKQA